MMRTTDFYIKPNAKALNESLNQKFGEKLDIDNYSRQQLIKAAALIESKIAAIKNGKFNEALESEEFYRLKLMQDVVKTALSERAVSKAQQQAAGAALAAKRKGTTKGLTASSKEMMKMSNKELEKYAGTKHKDLPKKVGEASKAKPDFLDMDNDGDKKEPMKKAIADKKKNPFAKKMQKEDLSKYTVNDPDEVAAIRKSFRDPLPRPGLKGSDAMAQRGRLSMAADAEKRKNTKYPRPTGTYTEATDPIKAKIGQVIGKYFGQIYDYGDDGLEYLDNNAPFWTMLFDKHDGDVDAIIDNEDVMALRRAAQELKDIAGNLKYELSELSKDTLYSYGHKADKQIARTNVMGVAKRTGGIGMKGGARKLKNRIAGSELAFKKAQDKNDQIDEADSYSVRNTKTDRIYHISKYPITTNHSIYKKIKAKDLDAQIYKNGQPVKQEGVNEGNATNKEKKMKEAQKLRKKEKQAIKESYIAIGRYLAEGEEGKAELIMAVKDMVDKFTGWSEDIAQMQAQTAMEMADAIRDEMGSDMAEQFTAGVQPSLDTAFQAVKGAREALNNQVGALTGNAPEPMGAEMPAVDSDETMPPAGDDMLPPPEEADTPPEGREKRESIERRTRLTKLLVGR